MRLYYFEGSPNLDDIYRILEEKISENQGVVHREYVPEIKRDIKTVIKDIKKYRDIAGISGNIVFEEIRRIPQIDGVQYVPQAVESDFFFLEGSTYFIPFCQKFDAEAVAFRMNTVLGDQYQVKNQRITTAGIERFLLDNPFSYRVCNWARLTIPGIESSRLAGPNITQSSEFRTFERLGEKNYVMIQLVQNGWVLGISESGIVVFYTQITKENAIQFINQKLIPLL